MSEQPKLSVEEVSQRILDAVTFCDTLDDEIAALLRGVFGELNATGLSPWLLSKHFSLPGPKRKHRHNYPKYAANTRAMVVLLGGKKSADKEDDETDEDDDGRTGIEITPQMSMLAVLVRLLEPDKPKTLPYVVGFRLSEFRLDPTSSRPKTGGKTTFKVKKRQLLSVCWEIDRSTKTGDEISSRILRGHLCGKVTGVDHRQLADFDCEAKVGELAERVRAMVGTA